MNFIRNLFSLLLLIVGFKASKNLDIVSLVFVKKIRRKYKEKDIMKTTTVLCDVVQQDSATKNP